MEREREKTEREEGERQMREKIRNIEKEREKIA